MILVLLITGYGTCDKLLTFSRGIAEYVSGECCMKECKIPSVDRGLLAGYTWTSTQQIVYSV